MNRMSFFGLHRADHADGFTLVELAVTMVVAGILAALAVPAFNSFVLDDRDAAQINSLAMSFQYARSEALKRNTAVGVQVCPSSDGLTCNNPAGGWAAGWVVYDMDPTDPSPTLHAVPALGGANALTATGGGANGVTFNSSGRVIAAAKIKVCDPRGGAYARDVEVSQVGTITASPKAGQDASGNLLACP